MYFRTVSTTHWFVSVLVRRLRYPAFSQWFSLKVTKVSDSSDTSGGLFHAPLALTRSAARGCCPSAQGFCFSAAQTEPGVEPPPQQLLTVHLRPFPRICHHALSFTGVYNRRPTPWRVYWLSGTHTVYPVSESESNERSNCSNSECV